MHLFGVIIKKFVTMHGHMNVKSESNVHGWIGLKWPSNVDFFFKIALLCDVTVTYQFHITLKFSFKMEAELLSKTAVLIYQSTRHRIV